MWTLIVEGGFPMWFLPSSLAETDPVALARVDPGGGARLGAGSCAVGA